MNDAAALLVHVAALVLFPTLITFFFVLLVKRYLLRSGPSINAGFAFTLAWFYTTLAASISLTLRKDYVLMLPLFCSFASYTTLFLYYSWKQRGKVDPLQPDPPKNL